MAKVILFNPPIYYQEKQPSVLDVSYPPLGILYLAAVLKKNKIDVKVVDVGAVDQSLSAAIALIKKEKPVVVGISAMTPALQGAVTLAKTIKEKFGRRVLVALGGPHVSADPQFIKRVGLFDFGVTGEAEETFLDLVKKILKGKKVRGVYQGKPMVNLDEIPWPARELLGSGNYLKKASLVALRGCPFNCYYCSRPAVSNLVRCRSPQDIVDEMESLYDNCGGEYLFQDDTLTIKRDHTEMLCEEMIKRKRRFSWAAYTRVDLVDERLLAKMAKAGCNSLTFGIESGNQKLRNEVVNKRFSNRRIREVIKLCRRYKIDADGFFMFGHPTETKKQVKETMNFILTNDFSIVGVSIATPFPGSKLWDYAVKTGIINYDFIDRYARGEKGQGYAGVYPVYAPASLDLDWLYEQRKKIMRRFYLRPCYVFQRLRRDLASSEKLKRDFIEGFNVLTRGSSARQPYQKKIDGDD